MQGLTIKHFNSNKKYLIVQFKIFLLNQNAVFSRSLKLKIFKMVFTGNNDGKTAVRRLFQHPVSGRFFRIAPVGYQGNPYLRFDLLSF